MTKPTMWLCTQWRLRPAWASAQSDQSLLCAQWVAKDPRFLHADSEGSDQTGRMPRLIWVLLGAPTISLVLSWGGSYNFSIFHPLYRDNIVIIQSTRLCVQSTRLCVLKSTGKSWNLQVKVSGSLLFYTINCWIERVKWVAQSAVSGRKHLTRDGLTYWNALNTQLNFG